MGRTLRRMVLVAGLVVAGSASAKPSTQEGGAFGIGGGLWSEYPPMLTLEGLWRPLRAVVVGVEAGYLTVPGSSFSGTSTYMGLEGRYIPPQLGGFFAGLAYGQRTFVISTQNTLTVNGIDNDLTWTRHLTQTVVYPQLGWTRATKAGHTFVLAAGLIKPLSTSFSQDYSPHDLKGGVTADEVEAERAHRASDVTDVTNATTLAMQVKYEYFFH